jgi:hypothetical protein
MERDSGKDYKTKEKKERNRNKRSEKKFNWKDVNNLMSERECEVEGN